MKAIPVGARVCVSNPLPDNKHHEGATGAVIGAFDRGRGPRRQVQLDEYPVAKEFHELELAVVKPLKRERKVRSK